MAVNNLNTPGVGIQPSLIDAKGDLLVGTANDAIDRLGVTGTTGAVLTADAGETTGLKWAAAGSVGGLVHIKTENFSAVSSLSLNDVFNANFLTYRMILGWTASASDQLNYRLRVSGSDDSTSNYSHQLILGSSTSLFANNSSSQSSANFTSSTNGSSSTLFNLASVDIHNPFSTSKTTSFTTYAPGIAEVRIYANAHNVASSFDGITILCPTGTMTGSIKIYGYKE
jgi:hypothetical protein